MPRKCNYVFPFDCWATWHCHQHKTRECCQVYAEMGSLYTVVELQNILYCCKQYKCTRSLCKVTDIGPSLTKFGFSWQTFIKVSSIKFYTNLLSRSHIKTCGWTDTLKSVSALCNLYNRYNRISNTRLFPSQEKELNFIKSSQFSMVKIWNNWIIVPSQPFNMAACEWPWREGVMT